MIELDLEAGRHQLLLEAGDGVPPMMSHPIVERGPDAFKRRNKDRDLAAGHEPVAQGGQGGGIVGNVLQYIR